MSEENDELELQALQRQLDDAFATTRPRRGFEDELWLRVQQARPAPNRLRQWLSSLGAGLRSVRAPAAAIAVVLIVGLTVTYLFRGGVPTGGGGGGSVALSGGERAPQDFANAAFGKLPSPAFAPGKSTATGVTAPTVAGGVHYVWAGTTDLGLAMAPVYRYAEPSPTTADRFASQLGTVLRDRPSGFLGSYSAATYTLKVRGTVQTPPSSPAYFIFSSAAMPALDTSGVGVDGAATNFLAAHRLNPDWAYAVAVDATGDPVKVVYQRQFSVPGYGAAYLVNANGARYGLEVDMSANRPILVSGLLPVSLDTAPYSLVPPAQALGLAVSGPSSGPTATLTKVELVYVLVPAGSHSFYEPAYVFTGTMPASGKSTPVSLLVPAVDPSQRA